MAADYTQLKALVVDDFDSFRMSIVKMLEEFGCKQVDSMMSGVQAVKACRAKSYDLVLCDYNLGPGKNGQQVLEELRLNQLLRPDSLFFIVSAESSKSIVLSAYDDEPSAYLTKPITAKSLQQRLDRQLRLREEMLPVYEALGRDDLQSALALGRQLIQRGARCASACQKLLAHLLLQTNDLDAAESIYRQVLEVRPLDWAQVGMARVKKARGDLPTADKWLEKIITDSPFCMQAYDELIDSCRKQGDSEREQAVLQAAVEISPMSILRQASLASVASENNDLPVAARAFSRAVRLGEHSAHDKLENHLQLGRTNAALFREDEKLANDLSRDAMRSLEGMNKRFTLTPEQQNQAKLLECQMHANKGDKRKASDMFIELRQQLEEEGVELDLDSQLDMVGALQALGQKDKATAMLDDLVEQYKSDQAALEKIDALLEEPRSALNRSRVAKINKEGIEYYSAKRYRDAVDCFKKARQFFPNHLGVHLNLVQSLIAEMKEFGRTDESLELCLSSMGRVESAITINHDQFKRYRQLQEMVNKLDRELKA